MVAGGKNPHLPLLPWRVLVRTSRSCSWILAVHLDEFAIKEYRQRIGLTCENCSLEWLQGFRGDHVTLGLV